MNIATLRRRRQSGGSLTLSQRVQAILAGRDGFAIDPSDTSTMFQDSAGSTPITAASQPVGRINAKWGNSPPAFTQATAAARPTWNGASSLLSDGVDDSLQATNVAMFSGVAAIASFMRYNRTIDGAGAEILSFISTSTSTVRRYGTDTEGARLRWAGKRLDADSQVVIDNAGVGNGGTLSTPYTAYVLAQYASPGTLSARINKAASTLAGTITGTPANASATIPASMTICGRGGGFYGGLTGRCVFMAFVPTAEEINTIEAWLEEVTL